MEGPVPFFFGRRLTAMLLTEDEARGLRRISPSCLTYCFVKQQAHRVLRPVGHSLLLKF